MAQYHRMTPGCRMYIVEKETPLLEFESIQWTFNKEKGNTFSGQLREGGFIPEKFDIVLHATNEKADHSSMTLTGCAVTVEDGLVLTGTVTGLKPWKQDAAKPDKVLGASLNFENVFDSHNVIGRKTAVEGAIKNLVGQLALYGDGKDYWNPMPVKITVKLEIFYAGDDVTEETEDAGNGTGHDSAATTGSD